MSYTKEQRTMVIAMYANRVSGMRGTVEELSETMRELIETELPVLEPQIGSWEIVWGPTIYQATQFGSDLADNAMYVARQYDADGKPWYVVGIAGTNGPSLFDWLVENFAVRNQVSWEYGNPPADTKIALGTFIGLSILQNMAPLAGFAGAGQTIDQFLATVASEESDVTVSGHSLGGALTAVLTLWLWDIRDQWNGSSKAALDCLPSAGPTPGNGNFATYYNEQIGQVTNRIWNRIDVVPLAWETNTLETVPDLYEPEISGGPLIQLLALLAIEASKHGDYTQLVKDHSQELPGTVQTELINPEASDFVNFLIQMAYQHGVAYPEMLGIDLPTGMQEAMVKAFGEPAIEALERRLRGEQKLRAVQTEAPAPVSA